MRNSNVTNQLIISKEISSILYGIAIWLMVWGHLFFSGKVKFSDWISLLHTNDVALETILSRSLISCVSIYAFITGYGLCMSTKAITDWGVNVSGLLDIRQIIRSFGIEAKQMIKRWFHFMVIVWTIAAIFFPIGIVFFHYEWTMKEILLNFVGMKATINAEWWYIRFYTTLLIMFPFLDVAVSLVLRKFKESWFVVFYVAVTVGAICFVPDLRNHIIGGSYFVFLNGYLCAKLNIYEMFKKNGWHGMIMLLFCIGVKYFVVVHLNLDHKVFDLLLAPLFVAAIAQLYYSSERLFIWKIFKVFGYYSVYIWLTHTFFCYYYWGDIVEIPKYSVLIFAIMMIFCLGVAWGLDQVVKVLKRYLV